MVRAFRFGRRLKIPSTVEIKHQLLTLWLKDQVAKEAGEAAAANEASASKAGIAAASRGRDAAL
jgi:hypothetical protein